MYHCQKGSYAYKKNFAFCPFTFVFSLWKETLRLLAHFQLLEKGAPSDQAFEQVVPFHLHGTLSVMLLYSTAKTLERLSELQSRCRDLRSLVPLYFHYIFQIFVSSVYVIATETIYFYK